MATINEIDCRSMNCDPLPGAESRRSELAKHHNDIRSTEKLLDIIRDKDSTSPPPASTESVADKVAGRGTSLAKRISIKRKIAIGVDIGHTNIRLAKVQRAEKNNQIVDYRDIPFTKTISLKDPHVRETLKSAMVDFCGKDSHCVIWGAIQSANVEIRCIHIPKLQRKQMANAIYWTFTKKVALNENLEMLDYEILGDINVGGIKKTEVLTFKAPKEDVAEFKSTFQQIGFPLQGISIVPFAIQNLFRTQTIPTPSENVCSLFVGRDWSRIAIYHQGNLVLSRGIRAGMRSMIEAIDLSLRHGINATAKANEDQDTTAIDPRAHRIFFDFIDAHDRKSSESAGANKPNPSQVFQMVLPAMERLVRQVERTFEHYALNFNREGVSRIYISGQVIANSVIVDYIGKQLDLPVTPMNPFIDETGFSSRVRIPETPSEREAYVPAIGLALADNAMTPNFLYTHKDKEAVNHVRRNNLWILRICAMLLFIMVIVFSWQQNKLDSKREVVEKLDNKLIAYSPPAEKEILLALFSKTKNKRKSISEIIQRYAPLAMVSELANITPAGIRLLSIEAVMGKPKALNQKAVSSTLEIEGIVFGNPGDFETSLTGYLLSLKNSPLFRKPSVKEKKIEFYDYQEVMHFVARLEVI